MSILKDPHDCIECNPDLNQRISAALDYRREKHRRRKRISEVGGQWLGHVYDIIGLFTLATVVAILLKLFLN